MAYTPAATQIADATINLWLAIPNPTPEALSYAATIAVSLDCCRYHSTAQFLARLTVEVAHRTGALRKIRADEMAMVVDGHRVQDDSPDPADRAALTMMRAVWAVQPTPTEAALGAETYSLPCAARLATAVATALADDPDPDGFLLNYLQCAWQFTRDGYQTVDEGGIPAAVAATIAEHRTGR